MFESLAEKHKAQITKPRNDLRKRTKLYQIPTKLEENELPLSRGCSVNEDHNFYLFLSFNCSGFDAKVESVINTEGHLHLKSEFREGPLRLRVTGEIEKNPHLLLFLFFGDYYHLIISYKFYCPPFCRIILDFYILTWTSIKCSLHHLFP